MEYYLQNIWEKKHGNLDDTDIANVDFFFIGFEDFPS